MDIYLQKRFVKKWSVGKEIVWWIQVTLWTLFVNVILAGSEPKTRMMIYMLLAFFHVSFLNVAWTMVASQHLLQFRRRLYLATFQLLILAIGHIVEKENAPRTGHIPTYVNATPIIIIFSISLSSLATVNVLLDPIVPDLELKFQIQPGMLTVMQAQSLEEGSIGSLCCWFQRVWLCGVS